ncbi:hypothetical protein OE88DRAFT_1665972 [Heliocybe sulcata]|uniref:Ubiquitin 3 binding protein But2 C-terminal domain-containing protein n=1 Tax=Heliocybe sulcata TaxID=5364 RepID=A0A5C3MQN6_9AGAM|nr:hypothetical protein OE88DRAFT_1665972 [Heliocybe sulcata]
MATTAPNIDYVPLLSSTDESDASFDVAAFNEPTRERPSRSAGRNINWPTAVCILCTVLNISLFFLSLSDLLESGPFGAARAVGQLPRPNKYMGLETINWTDPGIVPPEPMLNFPTIMTQVSQSVPEMVFPEEPRHWFSWIGTVYPYDRRFLVDSQTNTIAQFRVRDFGMEKCQVVIDIPMSVDSGLSPNTMLRLGNNSVDVQVWELRAQSFLDLKSLSFNTRPARARLLTVLSVSEGGKSSSEYFSCMSDTVKTFEFSCLQESPACLLDFWQDRSQPYLGAYLLQHPTV